MKFQIKDMSGSAAKAILTDLVVGLSDVDPEDMTTTERRILEQAADRPPKYTGPGLEHRLLELW